MERMNPASGETSDIGSRFHPINDTVLLVADFVAALASLRIPSVCAATGAVG
jgi:hypothetical protein